MQEESLKKKANLIKLNYNSRVIFKNQILGMNIENQGIGALIKILSGVGNPHQAKDYMLWLN